MAMKDLRTPAEKQAIRQKKDKRLIAASKIKKAIKTLDDDDIEALFGIKLK